MMNSNIEIEVYDAQNSEPYDDEFGSDENANYVEFLKISPYIKPTTSTQKIYKKKFNYDTSTNSLSQSTASTPSSSKVTKITTARTKEISCQTDSDQSICHQNHILLKALIKEVKYLRREHQQSKEMQKRTNIATDQLDIPRTTVESFKGLEEMVKASEYEEALTNTFNKFGVLAVDKYVRTCLRAIVTDEVASKFSWFGHNDNICVKSYALMNIIKECAILKFPTARSGDIIDIMKRWFQYAKDRKRKRKPTDDQAAA